jgi:hypothetical protein
VVALFSKCVILSESFFAGLVILSRRSLVAKDLPFKPQLGRNNHRRKIHHPRRKPWVWR